MKKKPRNFIRRIDSVFSIQVNQNLGRGNKNRKPLWSLYPYIEYWEFRDERTWKEDITAREDNEW